MNLNLAGIEGLVSAERFDEMSGVQLVLTFANGARLMICPENDALNYMPPSGEFGRAGDTVLCDMGSGHYSGPLKVV